MWFDIVCFIIIILGFFIGYYKGFLAQAGAVLGVVFGIICCNIFATRLAAVFIDPTENPQAILLANVMAYIIVFVLCYIIGRLIGKALRNVVKSLNLGFIDRLSGAIFTMLEYTLIFSIILNAWIGIFPDTQLRSDYTGMKKFVLNVGPTILGSPTVSDIFDSMNSAVQATSDAFASNGQN